MVNGTTQQAERIRSRPSPVYTALQRHYLQRLAHLEEMRKGAVESSSVEDPLARDLIGRGIFSVFRACEEGGVGREARILLHRR